MFPATSPSAFQKNDVARIQVRPTCFIFFALQAPRTTGRFATGFPLTIEPGPDCRNQSVQAGRNNLLRRCFRRASGAALLPSSWRDAPVVNSTPGPGPTALSNPCISLCTARCVCAFFMTAEHLVKQPIVSLASPTPFLAASNEPFTMGSGRNGCVTAG